MRALREEKCFGEANKLNLCWHRALGIQVHSSMWKGHSALRCYYRNQTYRSKERYHHMGPSPLSRNRIAKPVLSLALDLGVA